MRPGSRDDRLALLLFGLLRADLLVFGAGFRKADGDRLLPARHFLPELLFNVHFLRSFMTFSNFFEAALEYLRAMVFPRDVTNS